MLLLGLSYLGISIQSIINSPVGQENFNYASHVLVQAWDWIAIHVNNLNQFKVSSPF